ncbi:MAG: YkgJ family cysteine cluster protein [Planctomycetia bacterium]|nr:YkgJ family cysteine cluster protein [Planctomycetia bacterium]
MTELISKLELKKINHFVQKVQQVAQKIDIFCSAILLQTRRRFYYVFNKLEIDTSLKKRTGNCLRCGRCCHASFKCQYLEYDKNGLSLCKVYDRKPLMCSLYPYNESDYFYHLKSTCGYRYNDE